jgi:hypothetical protein
VSWLETKVRFVAEEGRKVLEDPAVGALERQEVMMDLVRTAGALVERHDQASLFLAGEILSILPLARSRADGIWRKKLDDLQEILLELRVTARQMKPKP